ncbi:MAG TPA: ATP-binding cassette domain-containing protein [Ktedonobacterales bacterium]|nr:ATP-binding cassette domain-containing protein [Ktedonobacterales bacterium]
MPLTPALTPASDQTTRPSVLGRAQQSGQQAGEPISLAGARTVSIGRAPENDIVLDHEQVSQRHARVTIGKEGVALFSDLGSTNGAYVNGYPVRNTRLAPGAEVRIGPYRFVYTGAELVRYDESKSIRIDAIDLQESVRTGWPLLGKRKMLLDHVSLSILPGTFVAVIGASGAGKTTLLNALNGQHPATDGQVLYNGQDYYQHARAFASSLAYVPQDDIIHKNLTVANALYYAARLRLPRDFRRKQIRERVQQVLADVEMTPQRHQLVSKLSGGQRKRVSIAVELLANPPIFFLDEPTSGLDPGLDRKMMRLLRRLADRGHTIVLTTHATSDISICDEVAFLAPGGRLAYYGPPEELRALYGGREYADIYNEVHDHPDEWIERFHQSDDYAKYVEAPLQQAAQRSHAPNRRPGHLPQPKRRSALRQFLLLARRYLALVRRDRMNVFILLAQAPIIAGLVIVLAENSVLKNVSLPSDFKNPQDLYAQRTLFIMVCSAVWFGTINSAREIVKEAPIYRRERAVGVRMLPYVLSKIVVLGGLCAIQSFLLLFIVSLKTGLPTHGVMFQHTRGGFAELYISLLLVSFVGLMIGLLISALAPNTDRAISIVPIVLIPQIIFANVVFSLNGTAGKVISFIMPARWGVQAIGTAAHVRDQYAGDIATPFYASDRTHEIGFWLALIGLSALFFALTLWSMQRHDALHEVKKG